MNKPKTKQEVEQRIRELLDKHPIFRGAELDIKYSKKKEKK